jgi:RNA polymerase sigma-70 factor (ECF subfamily)
MNTHETFTDDQIIQSVIDGNTRNFELLINRYKNRIINFINKMIFDYEEAQNIAQDVFIKIYETLGRYRMEDSFQSFIFTISKNLTLNYIKKSKRTVFFSQLFTKNDEDRHLDYSYDAPQEQEFDNRARDRMLIEALGQLKENQRLALVLKVYVGFSYNQIADVTGWSIPKIETLISRAKTQLKKIIFMQDNGK